MTISYSWKFFRSTCRERVDRATGSICLQTFRRFYQVRYGCVTTPELTFLTTDEKIFCVFYLPSTLRDVTVPSPLFSNVGCESTISPRLNGPLTCYRRSTLEWTTLGMCSPLTRTTFLVKQLLSWLTHLERSPLKSIRLCVLVLDFHIHTRHPLTIRVSCIVCDVFFWSCIYR